MASFVERDVYLHRAPAMFPARGPLTANDLPMGSCRIFHWAQVSDIKPELDRRNPALTLPNTETAISLHVLARVETFLFKQAALYSDRKAFHFFPCPLVECCVTPAACVMFLIKLPERALNDQRPNCPQ